MRPAQAPAGLPVWDRLVRVTHWSVALACATAWITTEVAGRWHEPAGYAALALVAARLAWGVVGTRYARFSQFARSPRATRTETKAVVESIATYSSIGARKSSPPGCHSAYRRRRPRT